MERSSTLEHKMFVKSVLKLNDIVDENIDNNSSLAGGELFYLIGNDISY